MGDRLVHIWGMLTVIVMAALKELISFPTRLRKPAPDHFSKEDRSNFLFDFGRRGSNNDDCKQWGNSFSRLS